MYMCSEDTSVLACSHLPHPSTPLFSEEHGGGSSNSPSTRPRTAPNFDGPPQPNPFGNRLQTSGASSGTPGASPHQRRARGSSSNVSSTPISGPRRRRRRRRTASNRRAKLGLQLPKDPLDIVSKPHLDWRIGLLATALRTSRRRRLLLESPPIGPNNPQHHENSDSNSASRNLSNKKIRSSLHPATLHRDNITLQLKEISSTTSSGVSSVLQTDTDTTRTAPRTGQRPRPAYNNS